jgi:hypothetical protein
MTIETEMKCVICLEGLKSIGSDRSGPTSDWNMRCIGCDDSWVCGKCYLHWDNEIQATGGCWEPMPCCICREPMKYSLLIVGDFYACNGGLGWQNEGLPDKLWEIILKNQEL